MEINVENLIKTAIEEMKNGHHQEAAKHFDVAIMGGSSDIDVPFFRAYCNCFVGKVGELQNNSIDFTNAFYYYVDEVKKLNDPDLEKKKLDYAVILLSNVVKMFKVNANNNMFTPSIGLPISYAAQKMNKNCINKLSSVNANVSKDIFENNSAQDKSNKTASIILSILAIVGIILVGLWWFRLGFFF